MFSCKNVTFLFFYIPDTITLLYGQYMYKIMDMVINEKKKGEKKHIEENKGKQQCVIGSASRIRLRHT